ncbi:DNA polymerase IV [Clostridiaceae bacterium DONG20-135]|uniref:DNA polymerase IV n=1 Tax=Copranaerobaculum intestinale TaxID=2692629 RepID=A0A6N8U6C4_9FIRM|nr:DNA polymerase IV [Copranaerobaculum intestinale]MXQ73746.1 DNA polymerase IV [Copranaerobaculum intestinale]
MAGRVIFHIDLNSFYASAEILHNTALEGQPVVVAGLSRRSVVSTASYEARKYGVHSAMPLQMAMDLCPNLVIVQGDYSWYEELSERFFRFIRTFSQYVEPASIDECYVDVTEQISKFDRPLDLAWLIQNRLKEELGLPCSIGIAPNKFLAKMASDMRKPMGITVLRKQELSRKLWPLPISDMQGIGTKTAPLLIANGISTIGDLADPQNESKIMTLMGKHGYEAIQNARGNSTNKLCYNSSVQSISQSTTTDKDIIEYDEVKTVLIRLAESLSRRAKAEGIKGSLISLSIRYYDFTNAVRSVSLDHYTDDYQVLLENALLLFDRNSINKTIRHLGIGLGSLYSKTKSITQLNMFQEPAKQKPDILAELNKQLQGAPLLYAKDLTMKKKG